MVKFVVQGLTRQVRVYIDKAMTGGKLKLTFSLTVLDHTRVMYYNSVYKWVKSINVVEDPLPLGNPRGSSNNSFAAMQI